MTLDTRAQDKLLRKFRPVEVEKILGKAALAGANSGRKVLTGRAPVGTSKREGQFYRRNGYGHGTFLGSVKARRIRKRGLQEKTIGYVIGPIGKRAFTRHWIEYGTRSHGKHPGERATHWVERSADAAFSEAQKASEDALIRYSTSG